ncbi:MAG: hypothetical protein E4G91_05730 [Candidatus Zixiibacteriota bacterium]|nr:MAG: hypothetical protein E4G91_05730 [candidate division Zixibacteria bacterium]
MLRAIVACGLMALLFIGLGGCGNDGVEPEGVYNRIVLEPTQFPTLKSGLIYAGWVIKTDADSNWLEYQEFGKFFWDEHDFRFLSPTDLTEDIGNTFTIEGNVYDYDMIAITLEPYPNDPDPKPSPTIIALSGIDPERSTLMIFNRSFPNTQNRFAVGTFSDGHFKRTGESRASERFGIWFIELTNEGSPRDTIETYAQGLFLPTLPDTGYLYEGWVALAAGDTVSTGKFFSPAYIDYDNSHCLEGTIPNFPGEDFIKPNSQPANIPPSHWPLNVMSDGSVFITLEPNPDNDVSRPSPFILVSASLPIDTIRARTTSFDMGLVTDRTLPEIKVKFEKSL